MFESALGSLHNFILLCSCQCLYTFSQGGFLKLASVLNNLLLITFGSEVILLSANETDNVMYIYVWPLLASLLIYCTIWFILWLLSCIFSLDYKNAVLIRVLK